MSIISEIEKTALDCGFFEAGIIDTKNVKLYPEIRKICEGNACRHYGTTWSCPPATGTLEECRERVNRYSKMLLISKKYDLEDSFDFEGMMAGMHDFKLTADKFNLLVKNILTDYILLSNEGCQKCETCTYPNAPCRFPETLHHSLEGYGFIVSELACQAGIKYSNGTNTVTYLGALIFND